MTKIIRSYCIPAFLIILSCMFAAGVALAQQEDYKEYTVKKGDTLWTISSKEMVDPFLWPKVWKENPGIKNPDLIYPGQKIRIPILGVQKQVPPPLVEKKAPPIPEVKPPVKAEKKEEPALKIQPQKRDYLVGEHTFVSSIYIVDALDSRGSIIGAPTERSGFGNGDFVYIRTLNPVKKGDKFYSIRAPKKVKHPKTGKMLGYLVEITGVVEVTGKESGETKAIIPLSYAEIFEGSLLIDYYEMEPPLFVEKPGRPGINGYIVASKESLISVIVCIDKGKKDGVEVGDLLGIISRTKYDTPNGYLQVIRTQESTSTAIIRKYVKEVLIGDLIEPITGPS